MHLCNNYSELPKWRYNRIPEVMQQLSNTYPLKRHPTAKNLRANIFFENSLLSPSLEDSLYWGRPHARVPETSREISTM